METRKTLLEVLMPVSQPHIRRKTVPEEAASELFCDVAVGRMDTIDWKKDGKPLPEDQDFQLSKNHSILIISEGQKLNCGSYSCNVSNEISWQETTLNWAIAGTSPPQPVVLRIAVTALAFAAVSGLALIAPCCQSEKLRIRGELWRWLSAYTHGLLCVSSTLAFTAALLWMGEEGPSASFIVPEILLTYVIIVTFLVSAAMTIQPAKLNGLKSTTKKACTEFVDITALTVSTAVVSFLPLLAILVCYHITQRWQKESSSSRRQDLQEIL
ncbi:uncharacterized protein LOC112550015 [Alligator sinensis]|uniref:Uncharacterized protein LOC112550015 n=1 Tax=Alligator sinensis TaxID=38654 RepID=A0A3Q0GE51_ALLSI|nr:uncharacterized protein LOC112550015 [Alligator sinensis]